MKGRLSGILSKAVYTALALFLLWVIFAVFINNFYDYSAWILAGSITTALLLITGVWLLIKRNELFFVKHSRIITAVFLTFMGAAQIIMVFPLRYTPIFDVDALFGGAIEWVNTGRFSSYQEYFSMFHNNWGGLILLRLVFTVSKFWGFDDFFLAASFFNSALSLFSMYLTGSVCAKLIGERGRITAYFIFLISLPFYFIAPAFYTDALTMVFPILILRLYIASREKTVLWKRLVIFAGMGLAAGVGYGIKGTVVIMLIAVMIDSILNRKFKSFFPLFPITIVMMFACTFAAQGIIYRRLDRGEAKKLQIPILHWVMMGTNGNGMYSPSEYEFTKSFKDPAERREAVKDRLSERLKTYDLKRYAELFSSKLDIDFGDGAFGLSDCLGCPHGEDNALHRFLLRDGVWHDIYKHICAGVLLALYIIIIVSCAADVLSKGPTTILLAPRLALLGLILFLLIWEARWRYFSNFVPVMIVSAAVGLDGSITQLYKKRKIKRKRNNLKKAALIGSVILFFSTLTACVPNWSIFKEQPVTDTILPAPYITPLELAEPSDTPSSIASENTEYNQP